MHSQRKVLCDKTMPGILTPNRETILVVDDNAAVLGLVVSVLEYSKFRVLSAGNGATALELANETEGKIDLLLSDVDMPKMSGPDLGEKLKKLRPEMQVMLMARGADGTPQGLDSGWSFIEKPFMPKKLIQMVTNALHTSVGPRSVRPTLPAKLPFGTRSAAR
jgi:DNA-binding NtrC family response regulator